MVIPDCAYTSLRLKHDYRDVITLPSKGMCQLVVLALSKTGGNLCSGIKERTSFDKDLNIYKLHILLLSAKTNTLRLALKLQTASK